jgi:hypothetical protein
MWTSAAADSLPAMTGGFDSIDVNNGKFEGSAHLCGDTSCTYALYESQDGATWTQLASITTDFPPVVDMTFFHDDQIGYLAASSTHPGPDQGVGLWYSPDGSSWTNVGDQAAFLPPCAQSVPQDAGISEIYRAGSAIVAVGTVACTNQVSGMLWTSVDGTTWESAGQTSVHDVVTGHGVFVASTFVGGGASGSEGGGGIVFSSDGLSWRNAKASPGADSYSVDGDCSIASVTNGFVGACSRFFLEETLSGSADGRTWQNLTDPVVQPRGMLRSDGTRAVNSDTLGVSVSSTDGRKWNRYPLPNDDGQAADAAAILGDRLVLWSYGVPRVWVGNIPAATP